jgi:hypothetical protein
MSKNGGSKSKTRSSSTIYSNIGSTSSVDREARKKILKLLALERALKKKNLPSGAPVDETQYSYSTPAKGKIVARKYTKKKASRKGSKKTTHVKVSKQTGGKKKYTITTS